MSSEDYHKTEEFEANSRPHQGKTVHFEDLKSENKSEEDVSVKSENKSEEDLRAKLLMMKQHVHNLKSKLDSEKDKLRKEKQELYSYTIHHHQDKDIVSIKPPIPVRPDQTFSDGIMPLSDPSKQHLRDIEQKCDLELVRLQQYMKNIKDLRSYWQFLKLYKMNEIGETQSARCFRKTRRMREGVPHAQWLKRNRTFI